MDDCLNSIAAGVRSQNGGRTNFAGDAVIISSAHGSGNAYGVQIDGSPLDVILTFATPSTFHGVAKHAIFAGVQRQRRSAPDELGAQHL